MCAQHALDDVRLIMLRLPGCFIPLLDLLWYLLHSGLRARNMVSCPCRNYKASHSDVLVNVSNTVTATVEIEYVEKQLYECIG